MEKIFNNFKKFIKFESSHINIKSKGKIINNKKEIT